MTLDTGEGGKARRHEKNKYPFLKNENKTKYLFCVVFLEGLLCTYNVHYGRMREAAVKKILLEKYCC